VSHELEAVLWVALIFVAGAALCVWSYYYVGF
jgi:hypothetical protein